MQIHDNYLTIHTLLTIACRSASRILRNPVLAEEAGERAYHKLTLACLAGRGPDHPEAWIRVVARRSACALLRSGWAHGEPTPEEALQARPAVRRPQHWRTSQLVREAIKARLSPRQRDALAAALSNNTTKDAARCCGMQPRDFRRYLQVISHKARQVLEVELRRNRRDGLPGELCP